MSLSRPRRGRDDEEEEQDGVRANGEGSTPAKRPRCCSCSCCGSHQETKDFYEAQIEILKKEMRCMSNEFIEERKGFQREMQNFYQNCQLQLKEQMSEQNRRMEQLFREYFNTLISEKGALGEHVHKHRDLRVLSSLSETRTHRLKFENKCCNDKWSRHDIMADDGSPIKVAIYDPENRVITNGPLSSIQVKIVVLDGEFNKENKEQWSENSFKTSIVHCRPGKQPLFANELYLRLENGVAPLCGIKFQDNSSFVPSKKFKLGAVAYDDNISEKILEGISECFSVKDGRGYLKRKDLSPSLSDPIHKLKKVAENGDRHKLLEKMNINLVKDFLWSYHKDTNKLRDDCRSIPDHDWNTIVEHALSCKPGPEHYSYCIPRTGTTIFFSSLYKIVGAKFNGKYASYEELNITQKDIVQGSKAQAYDSLKPRQRWVKIVTMVNTMVTTLHIWNKKPELPSPHSSLDEITAVAMDNIRAEVDSEYPFSFVSQTTSFEMTDILNPLVVSETSFGMTGALDDFEITDAMDNIWPGVDSEYPLAQTTSFEMTDILYPSGVPETSLEMAE